MTELGRLVTMTLEEVEKTERVGVSALNHFTQQQLLTLDACMECGRCEEACPAFATDKPLSPKKVVQDLKVLMGMTLSPGSAGILPANLSIEEHAGKDASAPRNGLPSLHDD